MRATAAEQPVFDTMDAYQRHLQLNADEEALRAAAASLKLQQLWSPSGSTMDAALPAMQRGGAGLSACQGPQAAALQGRLAPLLAAAHRAAAPRDDARFEPSSPPLVMPTPVRPHVLGSGASAFRPTAAALQGQWQAQHAAQLLQGCSPPAPHAPHAAVWQRYDAQQPPAHSPPKCRVSLAFDEPGGQQRAKQQFDISASCINGGADPLNGLLQAINYLDMHGGAQPARHALIRCIGDERRPPQTWQTTGQRSAVHAALHSPRTGGGLSAPSSPPTTPPRSSQHVRTAARSPTRGLRSPHMLRPQGGVSKAKSPGLQERLAQQRGARSSGTSGGSGATGSSPASSGDSGGTVNGSSAGPGATSHAGAWTDEDKAALMALVQEVKPCGAAEWEAVANRLGRWSKGGASAERMYRTLADPKYTKSSNRHGCRLNPRDGTPMHVMVEFALERLPGKEGNIDAIAAVIESNPEFVCQLDYSARPGTKTYPRWKDTLLGCFKTGRYRHLMNTRIKVGGKNIYRLVGAPPPPK